jgi:hypothetical protein
LNRGGRRLDTLAASSVAGTVDVEERIVVGKIKHLTIRRYSELFAAVADVYAPKAGHCIEYLVASRIPNPNAAGMGDHSCSTLSVKRTVVREWMKMMLDILSDKFGNVEVFDLLVHGKLLLENCMAKCRYVAQCHRTNIRV